MKRAVLALLFVPALASAGTIIGVKTTPSSATLGNAPVSVTHEFDIKYFNNEKFPCSAKLTYSDGSPAETISIQSPTAKITRQKSYTKGGTFDVTLTGEQNGNVVGCLGSQTSSVKITDPKTAVMITAGSGIQVLPPAGPQPAARINSLTLTENNDGYSPTYYITVNGTGDVECGLKVDILRASDNYNYGNNTLWSNKTPSGFWKNLTFTAAKAQNVGYEVKAYGAGNTPCAGSAELTIAPPPKVASLWHAGTPKQVYSVGEAVPVDLAFNTAPCMYDVNIHKAQGGVPDYPVEGFYSPNGLTTYSWPDFKTVYGSPFTPGDWSIVFKPHKNPPAGVQACAPNPQALIVNFKVQ